MNEFKTQLDALGDEIERRLAEEQKATKVLESNKILEEQIKEMDHRMKLKDEELELKKKSLEEMMRENENLNKDVEYFKDVAKTCKSHAEKAIADCEMYRNMLEPKRRLNEYLNH
jgi:predicted transglutaminase-like cysteine proteinase